MTRKLRKHGTSGQALIITSLIIAVLLLSTTYYVFEMKRSVMKDVTTKSNSCLKAIRLSTTNTMISALANFTNGGEREVFITDFNRLSSNIRKHYYEGECLLRFTPLNSSSYLNGTYTLCDQNGMGIASSYVSFVVNYSGLTEAYCWEFSTNVTTTLMVRSTHTSNGTEKTVNVTCQMLNENEPALMKDIAMFYQNESDGPWISTDSYSNVTTNDFGNGTYLISFIVQAQDFLQVSASAHDSRDVLVVANATSTQV
jgi:hypothetical protein